MTDVIRFAALMREAAQDYEDDYTSAACCDGAICETCTSTANKVYALRALAALVEQCEAIFSGGFYVTNHDPRLFDICLELAAGYHPTPTPAPGANK